MSVACASRGTHDSTRRDEKVLAVLSFPTFPKHHRESPGGCDRQECLSYEGPLLSPCDSPSNPQSVSMLREAPIALVTFPCPRCQRAQDAEALQCDHCGEILQQTKHGTNYAAEIRQGSATSRRTVKSFGGEHEGRPFPKGPSRPIEIISLIPELYDPRATFRLVKWGGFAGLALLAVAGVSSGLALLIDSIGYTLMESGVVLASAGASVFGLDLVIILYALGLTKVGRLLSTPSPAEALPEKHYHKEQKSQRGSRLTHKAEPVKHESSRPPLPFLNEPLQGPVTKTPLRESIRSSDFFSFAPLLFVKIKATLPELLAFAALASFLLLPQYRVAEPINGFRSSTAILSGFLHGDTAYASAESVVALMIPVALLLLTVLTLTRQPRQALLAWLISLALIATLFTVNYAKDQSGYTTTQRAMLGFEYGFWIVAAIVVLVPVAMLLPQVWRAKVVKTRCSPNNS